MCETLVSQYMSTDTDDPNREATTKIDVRVPASLLEQIDDEYERRGYTSRSEAIRDALRDWVSPPATLSEETLADLKESQEQVERGETVSADDVRERLDLDD
jgi:Arc/MetJ-type ribon-helix-helix transcriptional regulator